LRKATISFVMSIRPSVLQSAWTTRLPLDGFSWNLTFENFFGKLSRKFKFHYNLTRITGTLHEDRYTVLIISHLFLIRMKNVSDKSCTAHQNTHFVFSNLFFETRSIYEIMWKNIVERRRPQMTIWRMHIACWITKDTNAHTEYVILIALPLQQWLHEHVSVLRYTYIGWIVSYKQLVSVTVVSY